MNRKLFNLVLVVLGFLANLIFARSADWNILAILGSLVSGIGLANLTFFYLPNKGTKTDWLVPAVLLVVMGTVVFILRANLYFGLQELPLYLVQTTGIVLTIAPLARLYSYLTSSLKLM